MIRQLKITVFISMLLMASIARAQLYSFQKIGLEQGIPSARVNDFLEDSRGFFWLATEGAGLVRYDGFDFKTIPFDQDKIQPVVTALAEDKEGNIWLGTENMLVKYDGLHFTYFHLKQKRERIVTISVDSTDVIWLASQKFIYRFDPKKDTALKEVRVSGQINDLAIGGNHVWEATDSLLYWDDHKKSGYWNKLEATQKGVLACGKQGVYFITNKNELQLSHSPADFVTGTPENWAALNGSSLMIGQFDKVLQLTAENGLPGENYKGCYLDRSGVLWLYSNNGLTKLENTATRFYNRSSGLIDQKVYTVLKDGNHILGGTANGLNIINGDSMDQAQGKMGVILALAKYNGYTWLGTERGLFRFDGHHFTVVNLPAANGNIVFSLKGTDEGLWIGTGTGIFKYTGQQTEDITAREKFPMAAIYSIRQAQDGSLWFATYDNGFFRRTINGWDHLKGLGGLRLDSLRFESFVPISRDEFFAGTISDGLFHVKKESYHQVSYSSLDFAEIRSLAADTDNRLWIGTNKGLITLDYSNNDYRITKFKTVDEFLDEGCMPLALTLKDHILVAGASNGILVINTDQLQKTVAPLSLAITDVQLFYGEVSGLNDYSEGLQPFSEIPANPDLPHDLNFLSFKLAGLTGYKPENLIYRYRIGGPSDNWTMAGTRREAVFSNIKPGHYNFEAQVARPGGEWSVSINYPFNIKSPLWQRWWFITFSILFIGGISIWYVRDRVKKTNQRLRLENSLLEMERTALRLQMNPHFIFNALDSISSFIFKNDPQQAVRYLNNFAKLMRLTLESSMEHLHPVETEVSVLKNYLELEKLRFGDKFDYTIYVDEEIDYDVGIPPMLIQPHVENAILHGIKPKEGKGHLDIRFILEEEYLICQIEDDGIGRRRSKELPKRKDHRSMATRINRDRLRLLKVSRNEAIDIKIIDKPNDSGTKVVIKLPAESI